MNKVLLGLNAFLVVAVAFLFFKVYSNNQSAGSSDEISIKQKDSAIAGKPLPRVAQVGTTPTGKIAFVNIDKLNEESLEIADLVAETKRRKGAIEKSMESLNLLYNKKVEDFQLSQKAGIASQADMEAKAREIQSIESEAQNKQIQMDNLSVEINDKNGNFQKTVRDFLITWNNGKFDYVLSYSEAIPSMLLGNTTLEITDEVILELNSQYKLKRNKKLN
jgi:outer membrane protein